MSDTTPTITKLEKLYSESVEDFKVSQMNLRDKALTCSTIKSKWCYKMVIEEQLLRKMETYLDKAKLAFATDPNNIKKYGSDFKAKMAAESNEKILSIKQKIQEQKDCLRFMQLILDKTVGSFGFDIKNSIDVIKIEEQ